MKNKHYLLLFLLFGSGSLLFAQVKPTVTETNFDLNDREMTGFVAGIPFAKPDEVLKDWSKMLEKGTKSNVVTGDSYEVSIEGAELKDITDSLLNVYSFIEAGDSMIHLYASFEKEPDIYINSADNSAEALLVKLFLFDFAKKQYVKLVEDEMKQEEKVLKEKERELNQLVRQKVRMEKDIEDKKNKIMVAENAIRSFEHDLEMKQEEINTQKSKVAEVPAANKEAKKAAESVLKGLEKEKKKIFRNIEKEQKAIVSSKSAIQQNELDIQTNVNDQEEQRKKIEIQTSVLEKVEKKLNTLLTMEL